MLSVPEIYGSLVFNDKVMKERLPSCTYAALQNTIMAGGALDLSLANSIATVMKDWALEKGATHFTHWFQPMTGITAEKHESFIKPQSDGTVIMRFSGKELIKGEPDASSFPSGGLRSTFEARGYTAWDASSYAFIKDNTLCIPTAFISYSGQVLDKKTPLLRSMNLMSKEVKRFLKLFNKNINYANVTVGAEQEYFLVSKELFNKRKDLISTGRTLFGAKPPKGQELEDHYFGNIKPKVLAYMEELDRELWKLGVCSKTRHNETAPAQHELAPIYEVVNVMTDHNQLTMEVMKKIADKHNLVCLLHEKPFEGVNGSGKHNNWSVTTDDGENLLNPGKTPENNMQFLLFLAAVLEAVDLHQDLLRMSVATAGNDHRLGASEAPPAIISVYLGSELTEILDSMSNGREYLKHDRRQMKVGVEAIASFKSDTADRNRTSPFAFTGNKFEFRMLGSSINIACPNIMINTAVADSLYNICESLENSKNLEKDIKDKIIELYNKHKRIIFNGNNYSLEWQIEAEKRGLLNLKTSPEALACYNRKENIEMFEKHKIYTKQEIIARQEILLENYCKILSIEALTMLSMATKEILPCCYTYCSELSDTILKKKSLGIPSGAENKTLENVSSLTNSAYDNITKLEVALAKVKNNPDILTAALDYRYNVFTAMQELRISCDALESIVSKKLWPFPTYSDLLFSV